MVVLAGWAASGEAEAQVAGGAVAVDSIVVEGNQRVESQAILGALGIVPGDEVTYQEIQQAMKGVWETGLFDDVEVSASGGTGPGDPVVLTFQVEERPLLGRVLFEGLENVDLGDVREESGLRPGEPLSEQKLGRAREFIRSSLAEEGIPFAQIEESVETLDEERGEVALTMHVDEGHRVTVSDIRFSGNEAFSDSDLRDAMETRSEGFWWFRSGEYDEESIERDLRDNIPRYYRASGYLDVRIRGDTLVVDPESGKARLEIQVEEGPQYRLADFDVEGNRQFPTEELEEYYLAERGGLLSRLGLRGREGIEEDDVFDQSAFEEAMARVRDRYHNSGYIYASIQPRIERIPADDNESGHPRVNAGWIIDEQQQAFVNRVDIEGNDYTHDRVIRERIELLPGDVFSQQRLLRSYQSVQGLGFFETPLPEPDIQPDPETGDVDVTFRVEEQQTGSLNFGTTMGGGTGLSGFIGYDQPNLFGQAKRGSLRWDFGRFQNNFQLSYSDPSILQSRISGSVSLFRTRSRFFRFDSGDQLRTGIRTQFGIPVPGSRASRVNVGYSISHTDFELREGADDESLFARPSGTQSTAILGFTRRTLDHPLFPTVGSRNSFTSELSGGPLGGDADFVKNTLESEWWTPVAELGGSGPDSQPVRVALGLQARGGVILGDADRFPFERFWLGGVQFGERLRGYEETTVTPDGFVARRRAGFADGDRLGDAFLATSAELAVRLSSQISVSAFVDAGNIWHDARQVDPSRMFRGAGVGADLVTPFGPIGLDMAYGFDRAQPGWELHFRMGGAGGGMMGGGGGGMMGGGGGF